MSEERTPTDDSPERWVADRTTFQRVYDVIAGLTEPTAARQVAEWANCSENGAREALEQLVEMGIANRTDSRPALYRRNQSYFRWKRIEEMARGHDRRELRDRLEDLLEADQAYQDRYGVPDPDAVALDDAFDDHEALHDRWDDLTEWRTIRRDVTIVNRAIQRAESTVNGPVRSEP